MSFLRDIIGLGIALLVTALSAVAMPMAPTASNQAQFFPLQQVATVEHTEVNFAARAPLLAVSNVAVTGGITSMQGSAFALHGQETVAALFGFGGDLNAPNSVSSRPLTAGDLGINGQLDELTGTFTVQNGVANVRIDMIEGTISNPLSVVDNIIDTARVNGATSLRLEGTLANDRLLAIMQRRYGATTSGANGHVNVTP